MDATEVALGSRDVAVETSQYLVQLVVDLGLLLGMRLEISKDLRIDHGTGIAARHLCLLVPLPGFRGWWCF